MNVVSDTPMPNWLCTSTVCREIESSRFGGLSLVKTSCSNSHQFHLKCIINRLKEQSVPLNERRCCDSDQHALPLLRDSQLLFQNACQNEDLDALKLLGEILELNSDTPIESMKTGIVLDSLCAKAYLLLKNFQDNVLQAIKNKVVPEIKKCLPKNNDGSQVCKSWLEIGEDINSTLIESELKKLAEMDMLIVVCGMLSAGKSTTINAIVGFELLPERNTPMTLLPMLIRHKPGQSKPELCIKDPKPINNLLKQLRKRVLENEDEQEILRPYGEPLQSLIHNNRIKTTYQGSEEIFTTLTNLNDLFSLCRDLGVATPHKHYCKIDHMPTISVEYSFLRNHDNERGRGQLVLMDTPGYNDKRMGDLSGITLNEVSKQLKQASGILGLMNYIRNSSEEEEVIFSELEKTAEKSHCKISVWVNKWDDRNHNGENEDQLKNRLAGRLKAVLTSDDVYPVSARDALLAKTALRELEKNQRLPGLGANTWVDSFCDKALSCDSQEELNELSPDWIKNKAERLLKKSQFQQPLANVIQHANTEAALLAAQSASSNLKYHTDMVKNLISHSLGLLDDEINKLRKENIDLEEKRNEINEKLQELERAVQNLSKNQKSLIDYYIDRLEEFYFKEARLIPDEESRKIQDKIRAKCHLSNLDSSVFLTNSALDAAFIACMAMVIEKAVSSRGTAATIALYTCTIPGKYLVKCLINGLPEPLPNDIIMDSDILPFESLDEADKFLESIKKKLSDNIVEADKVVRCTMMKDLKETLKKDLSHTNEIIKDIYRLVNADGSFSLNNFSIEDVIFDASLNRSSLDTPIDISGLIDESMPSQNGFWGTICNKIGAKEWGKVKIYSVCRQNLRERTRKYVQNNIVSILEYINKDIKYLFSSAIETWKNQSKECKEAINGDMQKHLDNNKEKKAYIEQLKKTLESIREELKNSDVEELNQAIRRLMGKQTGQEDMEEARNSINAKGVGILRDKDEESNNRENNPTLSTNQTTQRQPVHSSQVDVSVENMELPGNEQPGSSTCNGYQQPEPSSSVVSSAKAAATKHLIELIQEDGEHEEDIADREAIREIRVSMLDSILESQEKSMQKHPITEQEDMKKAHNSANVQAVSNSRNEHPTPSTSQTTQRQPVRSSQVGVSIGPIE